MERLAIAGAVVSLIGLIGIIWSIFAVMKARRAGLSDDAFRGRMQRIMPINIGALMVSILGLGMVTIGLILS